MAARQVLEDPVVRDFFAATSDQYEPDSDDPVITCMAEAGAGEDHANA